VSTTVVAVSARLRPMSSQPESNAPQVTEAIDLHNRTRLVALFGGQSAEHEISLITARNVLSHVDTARFEIIPVAVTVDGQWVIATDAAKLLAGNRDDLPRALPTTGTPTDPWQVVKSAGDQAVVVLPLMHGPFGEDGTVQGLLEMAGVAYVGCGVLASALAMDKSKAKAVFDAAGIPQAKFKSFHEQQLDDGAIDDLEAQFGYPMFVKPANLGSSVGVSKAHNRDALIQACALASHYDEYVVVEESINGRELECSVLGNLDPTASLPCEIRPAAEVYDYDDKYGTAGAEQIIPAELPADVTEALQAMAIEAYKALGCEGMARVDFFYDEQGRGLMVNEVNTIPGFTPNSMYQPMWAASGLSYPDLVNELIRLAIERFNRRVSKRRTE